ncbi:uncharacterized protein PG986_008833 [Apiospora aurea]|uniref:F-box domain-containing protein n=1 Tax=Apiospora aurea TaxID=335848 RepID=A0ABR1Q600_9PEZI
MGSEICIQTFATTELLENILVHLDPKTLLTSAQLVQRRWRQLINDFETRLPWAARGEQRRYEAFMRPGASWRAMLVAQPPVPPRRGRADDHSPRR